MKKLMSASFLAAFALVMLLPVTGQVNAASVNHSALRQGPSLPGSGGHILQGPSLPGSGGHISQGPSLPGSGGH